MKICCGIYSFMDTVNVKHPPDGEGVFDFYSHAAFVV